MHFPAAVTAQQALHIERIADKGRIDPIGTAHVQNFEFAYPVLTRGDQCAKYVFGKVGNDIVQAAQYAKIFPRIGKFVNGIEIGFAAIQVFEMTVSGIHQ